MPEICFYFQLHQPYRLDDYNVFDLSSGKSYFSTHNPHYSGNEQVFKKVANKSYLPMLELLNQLAGEFNDFKVALSASGVFLEQAEAWCPEIIALIQQLQSKQSLEILSETYYHSLSFLYSEDEFIYQIIKHSKKIEQIFGVKPQIFRNTELIYSNHIAYLLSKYELGFKGILTEAVEPFLGGRKRTQLFQSYTQTPLPLMLKHAPLSDDLAFRFSDRSWTSYPLDSDKYIDWINSYYQEDVINLFMDFETFGEHQWEDTGIFNFFKAFVERFLQGEYNRLVTPSEKMAALTQEEINQLPVYDVPRYISWADIDRDLTAWTGNQLQADALRALYELRPKVLAAKDKALINDWSHLQTSDHFYYMCTKWSADGDVHAYFSPYKSPLEAYRRYSIVLADLEERLL